MTLLVEDGTIIAGANTYVDDAEYVAYAATRAKTIGSDATAREAELIKAVDYIESHRMRFKGVKDTRDQPLQWPRVSVWLDGYQLDSNEIPEELKRAQMETAIIINSDEVLNTGAFQNVQSESIGDLSVSYFNGGSWQSTQKATVDVYLNPLLNGQGRLRSIRV